MPTKKTHLSVRHNATTRRSMETLEATGRSTTEALTWALEWAAHCLEHAWATGAVPQGVIPDMKATYRPPTDACDTRVTQVSPPPAHSWQPRSERLSA